MKSALQPLMPASLPTPGGAAVGLLLSHHHNASRTLAAGDCNISLANSGTTSATASASDLSIMENNGNNAQFVAMTGVSATAPCRRGPLDSIDLGAAPVLDNPACSCNFDEANDKSCAPPSAATDSECDCDCASDLPRPAQWTRLPAAEGSVPSLSSKARGSGSGSGVLSLPPATASSSMMSSSDPQQHDQLLPVLHDGIPLERCDSALAADANDDSSTRPIFHYSIKEMDRDSGVRDVLLPYHHRKPPHGLSPLGMSTSMVESEDATASKLPSEVPAEEGKSVAGSVSAGERDGGSENECDLSCPRSEGGPARTAAVAAAVERTRARLPRGGRSGGEDVAEETVTDLEIEDEDDPGWTRVRPAWWSPRRAPLSAGLSPAAAAQTANGGHAIGHTGRGSPQPQPCWPWELGLKAIGVSWRMAAWWGVLLTIFAVLVAIGTSYLVFAELRTIPSQEDVAQRCSAAVENLSFIVNKEGLGLMRNVMALLSSSSSLTQDQLELFMTVAVPQATLHYSVGLLQSILGDQRNTWQARQNATILEFLNNEVAPAPTRSEYCVATLAASFDPPADASPFPSSLYSLNFLDNPQCRDPLHATFADRQPHLTLPVAFSQGSPVFMVFQNSPTPLNLTNGLTTNVTVGMGFQTNAVFQIWIEDPLVNYLLVDGEVNVLNNVNGTEVYWEAQSLTLPVIDRSWTLSCLPVSKYPLPIFALWSWVILVAMLCVLVPVAGVGMLVLTSRMRHASVIAKQLRTSSAMLSELKTRSAACVQAIPNPMILLDRCGQVAALSRHAKPLFELSEGGAHALSRIKVRDVIADSCPHPHPSYEGLFAPGTRQVTVHRPDGTTFPADMVVSEFADDQDPTLAQILLLTDVTEKCRMLARLEKAEADTRRAHAARSAMLLLMCHELRNPMHVVMAATEGLMECARTNSGVAALATDIQAIWMSANHVHSLIEDVLQLLDTKRFGLVEGIGWPVAQGTTDTQSCSSSSSRGSSQTDNVAPSPLPYRALLPGITGDLPSTLQTSTCLRSWLERQFQVRSCLFDLKRIKSNYKLDVVGARCANIPEWACTLLRKAIDQGYSMASIGAQMMFGVRITENTRQPIGPDATHNDDAEFPSRMVLSLSCSAVESAQTWLNAGNSSSDQDSETVVQETPLGADLFSIHNGSRGAAFTSAFTWQVLRKLVSHAKGEWRVEPQDEGVVVTIDVPIERRPSCCPHAEEGTGGASAKASPRLNHHRPRTPLPPSSPLVSSAQKRLIATPGLPAHTQGSAKQRVLVVEDNLMVQRITRKLLETLGFEVFVADNGRIAVDFMMDPARIEAPVHFIFMDLMMPEMDGFEAASLIHTANPSVPIVALTANAVEDERVKCVSTGNFVDFLTKPARKMQLQHMISRWCFHPCSPAPIHVEDS